jgi:hypothetical protein
VEPPTSRKRLREEAEAQEEQPCGESEAMVVWESVLDEFQRRLSLRPVVSQVKGQKSALCLEAEHIPLLQVLYLPSLLSPLSSVSEKKRRCVRNEESEPQRSKTGATMFLPPPTHSPPPPPHCDLGPPPEARGVQEGGCCQQLGRVLQSNEDSGLGVRGGNGGKLFRCTSLVGWLLANQSDFPLRTTAVAVLFCPPRFPFPRTPTKPKRREALKKRLR